MFKMGGSLLTIGGVGCRMLSWDSKRLLGKDKLRLTDWVHMHVWQQG